MEYMKKYRNQKDKRRKRKVKKLLRQRTISYRQKARLIKKEKDLKQKKVFTFLAAAHMINKL